MGRLMASSGVALAGLVTSVLTAILIALIDLWTGVNLFTFSFWVVIPVGAVGCGLVAASGYYFAAKALHQPATKLLFIQMVLIAALSQFLIYWFEYMSLTIDGVRVADQVPFLRYLDVMLTMSQMQVRGTFKSPEVGSFGYVLAAIEFIGFLIGGAVVYVLLSGERKCEACGKYLKTLTRKKDKFEDLHDYVAYADEVFAHPVDSKEFAANMHAEHRASRGTVMQTTRLLQCPQCTQQSILEELSLFDGKDYQSAPEYDRLTPIPVGTDIRSAFP